MVAAQDAELGRTARVGRLREQGRDGQRSRALARRGSARGVWLGADDLRDRRERRHGAGLSRRRSRAGARLRLRSGRG